MKTVIGTLLLTFVILLSSIQLSAQSGNNELPDLDTFENIPSGRKVRLSNGHMYKSLGTGTIYVRYNSITRDAYIRQGTRTCSTNYRVYPSEESFENVPPGHQIRLANDRFYTSEGNERIFVQYNTVNGVSTITQGTKTTIAGAEGLMHYPRSFYLNGRW